MEKYYEILGINKNATLEEVKSAYRKLSKKYHPDKHQGNELEELATEKFQKINEAYEKILQSYKNNEIEEEDLYDYEENNLEKNGEKKLTLYDYELTFPKEILEYNSFRKNIDVNQLLQEYKNKYESYGSIEGFLKYDYSYISNFTIKILEKIVDICISQGKDIYSAETFFNKYKNSFLKDYNEIYAIIEDRYNCIEENKENKNLQRKFKHNLKYEKTIFTHAGNFIQKAAISAEASEYKRNLYNNKEIKDTLFIIVERLIENTLDLVCKLIGIAGSEVLNKERAEAIYENIDKYPQDIIKEKICSMIINYPYSKDIYIKALEKVGDSRGELSTIANLFGISLLEDKIKILNLVYENSDKSSISSILELKEKLEYLKSDFNMDISEYIEKLDKKIEEYDAKERTILATNIVCETKEDIDIINSKHKDKFEILDDLLKRDNEDIDLMILTSKIEEIKELEIDEKYKNKIIEFLENKKMEIAQTHKTETSIFKAISTILLSFVIFYLLAFIMIGLIFWIGPGIFRGLIKIILGIIAIFFLMIPIASIFELIRKHKNLKNLGLK